ncbi:cobaltochelatase subunit CobN [Phreatobacter cathodiphilus]|uniref:Cobaltochelatase subunit CobN n=1 Tax=Phreatobacter cathodiphilus TaxID=1868589 RepID=A0A2S0NEH1_9HYPH|nr:cobaltochelatase subunit CobN [Phreatobacter cathodiphilus]AVO46545.1 cobaltochelatase subunit CobN [Phreatobacter cathodiphilus]
MHLLPTTTVTLDEGGLAVDLALPAADVVVLSFADSDLSALAAAERGGLTLALASLRRLRHPLSVDLLVEKTVAASRFVVIRCLGGLDYWRYGIEQVHAACRARGIALAVLPGDDRPDDRLAAYHTVPADLAEALLGYFHAGGGAENMGRLLRAAGRHLAGGGAPEPPLALPALLAVVPDGTADPSAALAALDADRPLALVLVYRSAIAAGDTALPAAIADALARRGLAPLVLALTSLKDPAATWPLAALVVRRRPAVVVTTTAFSAREGEGFVLDAADCPVIQAIPAGSTREAWAASPRGLSAADLAMQLALPEFDGRIAGAPVAFKEEVEEAGFTRRRFVPDGEGIAHVADLAAAWARLAGRPRGDRRLALVMTDYPARGGRAGFAVGLDTPASVAAIHGLLAGAGYRLGSLPEPAELMPSLLVSSDHIVLPLAHYARILAGLPEEARATLLAAHGVPEADPAVRDGAFRFPVLRSGHLLVALQPARDTACDRKGRYHDPDVPPGHGHLAFYAALREREGIDALIHLGTHGVSEWLPGKAVALSPACWPRLVTGALPVVYPYVVDDPGEAAPAKRRLSAVTLGHQPPPLAEGGPGGEVALLRDLVEDYSAAQVLDPRRADMVACDIRARARASGLAAAAGLDDAMPMDEALSRLDAHLCDLAEMPFRDGLHVFGAGGDAASAAGERHGLLAALDGRFVPPGPAGSPHRGRPDVLPTGRNLSTLDPRAIPTRAAARLGARAAAAVIARHLQDEGDYPRRIVMDLWASPTLRSGGEDIAHALALMGVVPTWDAASTRVTGFEILPLARLDHPRVDVTARISGAFRDTFPDQIALIDAAARAVAALDEEDGDNGLAAARRRGEDGARVFGAVPGRFGTGVAGLALDGPWQERSEFGEAYLATAALAYGGPTGDGDANPAFAERVAAADAFIHVSDVAGRDILEASSAADAVGGFVAAAQALGASPRAYSLDTSRPEAPRARSLAEDLSRIVHGRLAHPRWIEGQLRHGWRGAAELAEALDALFVYAATTDAVPSAHFDTLFQAWLGDPARVALIEAANPPALAAIRARFAEAMRRRLWVTRLNSAGQALATPADAAA